MNFAKARPFSPDKVVKATLTRVDSTHRLLRTDTVSGVYAEPPSVGDCFFISGEALDPTLGNCRIVRTSPIVEVTEDTVTLTSTGVVRRWAFRTENSSYILQEF